MLISKAKLSRQKKSQYDQFCTECSIIDMCRTVVYEQIIEACRHNEKSQASSVDGGLAFFVFQVVARQCNYLVNDRFYYFRGGSMIFFRNWVSTLASAESFVAVTHSFNTREVSVM
ncbi:hypothetical protein DEB41_17720 (plasmid) [Vibrio anguillarum]|uniref:Uncharacterized protein n=6 Tax=Vibrio anguillarum TaxID=55601 RepID=A0A7U5W5Y6_VIBAN|nr:hypothetical protein [Vibrio anguillarum]AAR12569.1 hypothetical protein [Vibrio anguillarum 775]AVT65676.1 hypothetical protein B5S57_00265 [Vibrio anguillarum]AXN09339.1 hypothetical protein DEA53_17925 [Vibrio anguillarum]AXN12740.1 hypothetical protein DEB26_17675 [Vibrio anguillarum]AXN16143.1 hypothetical protein DEB41_17720 [Vibrio anguillarum]